MSAEVVGTAYVRIRAITTKLASDIKDGLDKGAKDADPDVEAAGESIGKKLGSSMGDELNNSLGEKLRDSVGRTVGDKFGRSLGDGVSSGLDDKMREGLSDVFDLMDDDADKHGNKIGSSLSNSFRRAFYRGGSSFERDGERWFTRFGKRIMHSFGRAIHDDDSGFSTFRRRLGGLADHLKSFSQKFKIPLLGWGVIFAIPALGGAIKIIGTYLLGLVSLLGAVVQAAFGAGIALGAVFIGAALSVGVLVAAFKTASPAMDAFKNAIKPLGPAWKEVALATQLTLLPGLADTLMLTRRLIPAFKDFGTEIGSIANATASMVLQTVTSEKNLGRWRNILGSSSVIAGNLGKMLVSLADAFIPLLEKAMPLGERLSESIAKLADRFNQFIQRTSDSGQLTAIFEKAWFFADAFGDILGDLVVALWNVFSVGADASGPLLWNMAAIADRWREFTGSADGKNRLREIFDNAIPVMQEVNGLVADLARMIFEPALSGDTEGVIGFLRSLRETILPSLKGLADALAGNLDGAVFTDFIAGITSLVEGLAKSGGIEALLTTLTLALQAFAAVLKTPGLGEAIGIILTFIGVLKGAGIVVTIVSGIASALGALKAAVLLLAGVLGWPVVIILAIIGALTALYFHVQPFRDFVDGLVEKLKEIGVALWDFFSNLDEAPGKIRNFVGMAKIAIQDFAKKIPGWLKDAATALVNWIKDSGPDLVRKLWEFQLKLMQFLYVELPVKIGGWLLEAGKKLVGWIIDVVPDLFVNLWEFQLQLMNFLLIELPPKIVTWLLEAGGKLVGWIVDQIPKLLHNLGYFLGFLIGWLIRLPIEIATRVHEAGKAILRWIVDAAQQAPGKLAEFAVKIFNWAREFIPQLILKGHEMLTAFVSWLVEAVQQAPGKIAEFGNALFIALKSFLLSLPFRVIEFISKMVDVGEDIIDSLIRGLENAKHLVLDWFKSLGGGIVDGFKDALGFGSPSKYMIAIGKGLIDSMIIGLDNQSGAIVDAIKRDVGIPTIETAAAVRVNAGASFSGTNAMLRALAEIASEGANVDVTVKIGDEVLNEKVDKRVDQSQKKLAAKLTGQRRGA